MVDEIVHGNGDKNDPLGSGTAVVDRSAADLSGSVGCQTCGGTNPVPSTPSSAVYAVGVLSPQIPTIGVAAGFAQLTGRPHYDDRVDVELLQSVLRNPDTAYLGRHLCWNFSTGGLEAFTVIPQNDAEVARLAEVLPPAVGDVVHVVVGKTVPLPSDGRHVTPGLPVVQADRVLAFTLAELAAAMPEVEPSVDEQPGTENDRGDRGGFESVVRDVFLRLTRRAGNRGLSPEDIACNHIAVEYPAFHRMVWQQRRDGKLLMAIDAHHTHSTDRMVVAVRATFRDPHTHITERLQVLDDVTEPSFPFLLAGIERVY
ncbi:hypothetical protein JHN63_24420 [Streptomyces sp. MBT65]|uniref:cyanobactin maturation protease PatG family protein n=1 Tax=Streptomyces sp. MBT65 TaxID=1488395 RepID=UPI00190C7502|nr:hypothetical protein [Streptomyces sp. MBT65]MBK3576894.1 hypothetical protein [Streptomyces sp. MBT65]